jgi:adenosylhomocysteine nucleosidase
LNVLVLQTGIGPIQTETALNWVLSEPVLGGQPYRPGLILSAGFAGALQDGAQVGDIILATEVTNTEGKSWLTSWPRESPDRDWPQPLHRGRLLSVPALITSPQEKRTLGQKHQAVAVDMETATVARVCAQRRVPFGSLRVISDDVQEALSPRLVSLFCGGRVSGMRVFFALVRSPSLAAELITLAKQTRFAAAQLGRVLSELLSLNRNGSP